MVQPDIGHDEDVRPDECPDSMGQALLADAHHLRHQGPRSETGCQPDDRSFEDRRQAPPGDLPFGAVGQDEDAAFDPVVLARTRIPDSRKAPAMSLVTLDFPRVPVTQTRIGIRFRRASRTTRSTARKNRNAAAPAAATKRDLNARLSLPGNAHHRSRGGRKARKKSGARGALRSGPAPRRNKEGGIWDANDCATSVPAPNRRLPIRRRAKARLSLSSRKEFLLRC